METNKEYLKRLLPLLKKEIPSQWRVQSFSKNKPIATVMSYIDQRDLMDVLDAYCDYGWEKKYAEVAGNVFCSIGIHMPDGTVHWRSDCGVESNQDAEKGRASDAAKRAGVNWGIGRFLYDMKIQYIDTDGIKGDADKVVGALTYKKFPNVIDKHGKKIWDLTEYVNNLNPNAPKAPVQIAEPTPAQQAEQIQRWHEAITEQELARYKEIINGFTAKLDLNNYYKGLTADVQGNLTIQGYLKDRQEFIKKQG